ncbi:hypothetical protein DFH07DRAFT_781752 [Mycena maculata]|uniref:Uncharacterized protein n=1 Tax=Mycena maculata TaxID=230809 RepID=A0AAD7MSJ0_9AGAR|nr:hypothetical protein DFH07DRAFT_781752 [Mycena maculata]
MTMISRLAQKSLSQCSALTSLHWALLAKWDPRSPDGHRTFLNDEGLESRVTFQDTDQIVQLTDGFRVFTKARNDPVPPVNPQIYEAAPGHDIVKIYQGSTLIKGGDADTIADAGVYHSENDARNKAIRLPESLDQTTHSADIVSTLVAVRQTPRDRELHVISKGNKMV